MECGYKGTVAVEGNIQHGLLEDTQICAAYLHKNVQRFAHPLPCSFPRGLITLLFKKNGLEWF